MVTQLNPFGTVIDPWSGADWSASWDLRREKANTDFFRMSVENRIRRVFHLGAAEPLPLVRRKALWIYHLHLARYLSFPFRADHCEEMEPLVFDRSVLAKGLCDPLRMPLDSTIGVLCDVEFRNKTRLPLALLRVDPRDPNSQMIDDYWHWFWNCR